MPTDNTELTVEQFKIKPPDSLHNSCRAVWVCKRCGNCAAHCKHDDLANFHEDLDLPCSGPCRCIDCVPCDADTEVFKIKPLEWAWLTINGIGVWHSDAPVGNLNWRLYQIGDDWHLNPSGKSSIQCASPEEGKQIAEQHWQEYIKSALIPVEN